MKIEIPKLSLVMLFGAAKQERLKFAKKHFRDAEILFFSFSKKDFDTQTPIKIEALYHEVEKRCALGKLTVVDATEMQPLERKQLISIAKKHHLLVVGISFEFPEKERDSSAEIDRWLFLSEHGLSSFSSIGSPEEMDQVTIQRVPLQVDRTSEQGPFDVIGDIHGCFDELCRLLKKLGYQIESHTDEGRTAFQVHHPDGRKVIFLGDLVDRGPKSPSVLQLVMDMVEANMAHCVMGNHDDRFYRVLSGRKVLIQYGLKQTLTQIRKCSSEWKDRVRRFLEQLPHHYVFDSGRLVVAHAGLIEPYHGRHSKAIRSFAIYGDPTGQRDEYGFPIRRNWAKEYHGEAWVIYGHTPVEKPVFQNRTVNIDTGCVFGGRLTAFRYPEQECVSVPSFRKYADLGRPFFTQKDFQ